MVIENLYGYGYRAPAQKPPRRQFERRERGATLMIACERRGPGRAAPFDARRSLARTPGAPGPFAEALGARRFFSKAPNASLTSAFAQLTERRETRRALSTHFRAHWTLSELVRARRTLQTRFRARRAPSHGHMRQASPGNASLARELYPHADLAHAVSARCARTPQKRTRRSGSQKSRGARGA